MTRGATAVDKELRAVAKKLGADARLVRLVAAELGRRGRKLALSRGDVVGPGGNVGQFWTPPPVARQFVRWSRIRPGTRVLDAGAGMGALSLAALEAGATVTAVELDEKIAARVAPLIEREGGALIHQDFLGPLDRRQVVLDHLGYGFDVSISNPPWEEDLPERFFERMLDRAPRATGIVPLNMLAGVERAKFWRGVEIARAKFLPRRPNFGGPSGGKRDVMFLELRVRGTPRLPGDVDYAAIEVGE